jgi:hypothetical protein
MVTPEEEIAQLKSIIESQRELIESMSDHNVAAERFHMMQALGARIDYLQKLCQHAADVLEGATKMLRTETESRLIAQLRKAA